ncbi:M48 family metalloprotease [Nocardia crassostreae]|uniref:M48 family metalloprotease n=1 Tax=Nocardia crassostreae TaxID=53428 RepID=UPI0008373DB9|nr:M48 family metalloprotease [Nocardia crassostreae]
MPSIVLAGVLVARVGGLLGHWGTVVLVVLWLCSGVPILMIGRGVESVRPDVRTPDWTPAQANRLLPAWRDVVAAAGISEDDYVVMLEKSREVQGWAMFFRTIRVTTGAVRTLHRPQLGAQLAHELGHLLSTRRQSVALTVGWLSAPLYFPPSLVCCAIAIPAGLAGDGPLSRMAAALGSALYLPALAGFLLLVFDPRTADIAAALLITQLLARRLVCRRDERMADRVAVDLGFGDGLSAYLREHGRDCHFGSPARAWTMRLSCFLAAPLSTHPSTRRRIRSIHSRMRRRESGQRSSGVGI